MSGARVTSDRQVSKDRPKAGVSATTRDTSSSDPQDRTTRFGEDTESPDLSKSKNVNELRPYYSGSFVDDRMAAIRKAIVYIRANWHSYDQFMASLKQLMYENAMDIEDTNTKEKVDKLFSAKKTWKEKGSDFTDEQFESIRLYTTLDGFRLVFRVVNGIFRQDDSVLAEEKITAAVFLVELINIDMFNYCLKNTLHNNFQGIVYRGMALSSNDMQAFTKLRHQPVSSRYIAIPLCLWSTTSDVNISQQFIKRQLEKADKQDKLQPLLMKIHVIELDPEHLAFYRKKFPSSVVSTICAVNIADLSAYPNEKEVLLRGPFFQVLHLYESGEVAGKPCQIIEMVMLNTNRDHVNSFLGDQDAAARTLFGTMVGVTRGRFSVKYCQEKGLLDDLEEYTKQLKEKEKQLDELMK